MKKEFIGVWDSFYSSLEKGEFEKVRLLKCITVFFIKF